MIRRLLLCLVLVLLTQILAAQEESAPRLNLPAFGFLSIPKGWQLLWDHPYAPAAQSPDGQVTVRFQPGDTLETPLTAELVGKDAAQVLKSLNLTLLSDPRPIHFDNPDSLPLDGLIVETQYDDTTNRLLVLTLPPYQDSWYLITLDAPAKTWKAFLPQAEALLKTFHYIPNAPLLRVVLAYDLPQGAVLRRHELAALESISQRLHALSLETPLTVHLLPDQTVEIGFYGAVKDVAGVADWVSQMGFLELVDFSGVESPAEYQDALILTTGRMAWQAANQPMAAPQAEATPETALLNPTTQAPFETVIQGTDFSSAEASSDHMGQWQVMIEVAPEAQPTLKAFTEAHMGSSLALVLDGRVILTPRLQSALSESLMISGMFGEEESQRLAALLASAPLPVPMKVDTIQLLE